MQNFSTPVPETPADLRRELHRHPELSGSEAETAARICRFFEPLQPDDVIKGLGGHGAAFVFSGAEPGPTVLLRCELDGLPIRELNRVAHRSTVDGRSHACGHDGHMAILASVGQTLSAVRPPKGRVVLLYQPAEENGGGAEAVIRDPRFSTIRPDFVFALHNLPGFPFGTVVVRTGTFCCASRGVVVSLEGTPAHAAQPETGTSPARAMCRIMKSIDDLPARLGVGDEIAFATIVGARLGADDAFGTAPGEARVMATLRSETDETLKRMVEQLEKSVRRIATLHGLRHDVAFCDDFVATVNSRKAVDVVRRAASGRPVEVLEGPFRWSEDFGRLTALAEGAVFGIGAGEETPALHNPAYDFPDELIPLGAAVFEEIIRECLGDIR
jgi:amidohydrolase